MSKYKVKIVAPHELSTATKYSVGYDLRSIEDVTILPGEIRLVHTGVYLEMPPQLAAQVCSRSGLAYKYGVFVLNSPGIIDPDYRGEVGVILINAGNAPFHIRKGERIAQLVFSEVVRPDMEYVTKDELSETERGSGGFGSTGTK